MHKVVRTFPFSENGIAIELIPEGTVRDFGDLTDGLLAEGLIASTTPREPVVITGDSFLSGSITGDAQLSAPVVVPSNEPPDAPQDGDLAAVGASGPEGAETPPVPLPAGPAPEIPPVAMPAGPAPAVPPVPMPDAPAAPSGKPPKATGKAKTTPSAG